MSDSRLGLNPFRASRVEAYLEDETWFKDIHVTLDGRVAVSLKSKWWDQLEDDGLCSGENRFYGRVKYTICGQCEGHGGHSPKHAFGEISVCQECNGERVLVDVSVLPENVLKRLYDWAEFEAHMSWEDSYLRSHGY